MTDDAIKALSDTGGEAAVQLCEFWDWWQRRVRVAVLAAVRERQGAKR